MSEFFHQAQKELQTQMGTARIAARIEQTRRRTAFNETDQEIIGKAQFFFIASSAPDGTLDCSVKSGHEGFVKLEGTHTLLYPDYDGNGMFRTLGNIRATSTVALLFIEFSGEKRKLRIRGRAEVVTTPEIVRSLKGAQAAVRISVTYIFPNCPRYLPTLYQQERSEYVEALGEQPLEPLWKDKPDLKDFVHKRNAF